MIYSFQSYQEENIIRNHLNLGGINPQGEKIEVNSRYLERGGRAWIPIVGEFHFCRYDHRLWSQELAKMKAGGITVVSTYLFWIYHEEEENQFCFEGDYDIRKFILLAKQTGLDVIIRIGGWVHGECRNGGFPDWLLQKDFLLRDNNEGYLAQIRKWYGRIYEQLKGLFYKDGGNIIGIQLENELVENAGHIAKLKEIAIETGMDVPLFTATGWNHIYGARIPEKEVIPVFGGYCEAPWEEICGKLPPSVNYFFTRQRNQSAIDSLFTSKIEDKEKDRDSEIPYHWYPFATCELGGGIMVTHHRRPIIAPMDIYAMALTKLGCGNRMPGYYMYHGGTHKIGRNSTFQESKATGYPNDYPIRSYDFQAPLGEYGQVREHYRLLKLLHLFLQDYEEILAPMEVCFSKESVPYNDTKMLRYAMSTDGKGGFIFVNHYQRLDKLEAVRNVCFETPIGVLPSISVNGDIAFFIPFGLEISTCTESRAIDEEKMAEGCCNPNQNQKTPGSSCEQEKDRFLYSYRLDYALAQPLCIEGNTYFFMEIPGIKPKFCIDGIVYENVGAEFYVQKLHIVILTMEQAKYLYRLEGKLYLGKGFDLYLLDNKITLSIVKNSVFTCEGELFIQSENIDCKTGYFYWDGNHFVEVNLQKEVKPVEAVYEKVENPPFETPYLWELKLDDDRLQIDWYRVKIQGEGILTIDKKGDVLQLYVDGELAADTYYFGCPWEVDTSIINGEVYLAVSEWKDDHYHELESEFAVKNGMCISCLGKWLE